MCAITAKTHPDEVDALWRALKADADEGARDRLLEHYLPLVKRTAERLRSKLPDMVDLDDLVSSGVFGLIDAVRGYDPGRGIRFETYGAQRIRGAMLDGLRSEDWVPRIVRSRARKLEQTLQSLQAELGRMPTEKETAKRLAMSVKAYRELRKEAHAAEITSLSAVLTENHDGNAMRVEHVLQNPRAEDPRLSACRSDLREFLTRGSSRAERLVLILYYYEGMTLEEIGETLGLSESRISQIHSGIISRLRRRFEPGSEPGEELRLRTEDKSIGT